MARINPKMRNSSLRANRLIPQLRDYYNVQRDEIGDALTDIVADVMHVCRVKKYDHWIIFERARMHFNAEVQQDKNRRNEYDD